MFHIWRFTLRFMWNELHKIDTLKNVSMLALSQKYVLKNYVPDLTARLYDQLWYPNLIWINVWNIYLLCVNVVYLNKCAHTIKSLNLTDSVQNVWQENIDCPFPFIISKVHVKRCMNFRYNSYIHHFRVSTFFTLWIERGSFN